MKKFFRVLGNIIVPIVINLAVTIGVVFIYSIILLLYMKPSFADSSLTVYIGKIFSNIYVLTGVSSAFTLIIYFFMYRNNKKDLFDICSFKKITSNHIMKVIIISIALSFSCSAFVFLVADNFVSYELVNEGITMSHTSILSMLYIAFFAPIFEEILFRGLILNEIKDNYNIPLAIILQGLMFGVFHGNMLQFLYASFLGIILGVIYIWTKSIYSCILCHMIFNILGSSIVPIIINSTSKFAYLYLIIGLILVGIILINMIKESTHNKDICENEITL